MSSFQKCGRILHNLANDAQERAKQANANASLARCQIRYGGKGAVEAAELVEQWLAKSAAEQADAFTLRAIYREAVFITAEGEWI
jgi:hypothetical protein